MDRAEWSLLPVMIIFASLGDVLGFCDPMNPCPPPFPDFMAIFSETLQKIPELRLDNWTSPDTDCPTSVNWTEFNSRLEAGDPAPLNPVCSRSTTPIPTDVTQSGPSYLSSSFGSSTPTSSSSRETNSGPPWNLSSSSTQGSTEKGPAVGNLKESGDNRNIGLPVGIAVGGAVLILVVVVVVVVVCRRRAKRKPVIDYLRNQSTTSHDGLIHKMDELDTPQNVVIIPGFTCQESSTDATIRRPHGDVAVVVIENKISDEKESRGLKGCDNKAFEAAVEDLEDPGYEGSEACQENWENEWNNKFEDALMESNEDLPQDPATEGKVEIESDLPKQNPAARTSILRNTSKKLPSSSPPLNSPSTKKPQTLRFDLSSSTKPVVYPVGNSSPTKPLSPTLSSPSSSKEPALKFDLPSPTKPLAFPADDSSPRKPPTSPFSQPSPTKWPASGIDKVATPSRSNSEQRPPSLTPTLDAPPAYSSPIVKPNETRPFSPTKPRESSMHPTSPATPMTPSGLPTYTEVMAVRSTQSPSRSGPNPSQKQQRPTPPKRLDHAGAVAASGSNPLTSQPVDSSARENPNPWKLQAKRSSKATSEPEKPANTAVVRPWTGNAGSTLDGRPSALHSTPAAVTANQASAATEEAPSDSVVDYSFRPVRSLLSQFEAVNKNNP